MLVLIALATSSSAACGGARSASEAPGTNAATAPLRPPGEAQVGDRTTCPVSGQEFVVRPDAPKVEHGGKIYFFCCPGCDQKFQADPQTYLQAPNRT